MNPSKNMCRVECVLSSLRCQWNSLCKWKLVSLATSSRDLPWQPVSVISSALKSSLSATQMKIH